jgi:TolB-like protein
MIYDFAGYELDTGTVELRQGGRTVALQPQVLDLLFLLVENHERLVSRDEIVEKVWNGRAISEAAISSRIKALRQALGDDGAEQRIIRTTHGRGFRCIAEVSLRAPAEASSAPQSGFAIDSRGALTVAVLPFRGSGDFSAAPLGDALAHDIIVSLSRLRWLRVIARGSSFRFREPDPDLRSVGQALNVRYCLTGDIEPGPVGIAVYADLADTRDGTVVWSERYSIGPAEIGALREVICQNVAAALEFHIPVAEAAHARTLPEPQHDGWSRFHLGLHHMYRLNRADNARAAGHFHAALALEPEFARAWAGLSFTAFQSAYLGYDADRAPRVRDARAHSEQALSIDSNDAFSHFTMGRAHWLESRVAESLPWLEGATELSPSYAHGHYSIAWAAAMLGRAAAAHAGADMAIALSPLDPFLYAMHGTKALAFLAEGRPVEAVPWIDAAAGTPGAHPVVGLVAAACHGLAGDKAAAVQKVTRMRERNPGISLPFFFRSMPFAESDLRESIGRTLAAAGLP